MSKKILIVSDTHGDNTNLRKAVANMKDSIDLMIHLGDMVCSLDVIREIAGCPVEMVKGNSDSCCGLQSAKLIDIAGHKAFITHGHIYGGAWGIDTMKDIARENGAEIVMFGHTHEPLIERSHDITVLNPGSLSRPRQDTRRPTYIVMTAQDDGKAYYSLVTM
ncbi:MAG TPA: YfcE family phosphodiesterase [Lachnospiraceae bacterium]|nr:YfcE family phosphodiesterase [Lachnospiraceae bacterium]